MEKIQLVITQRSKRSGKTLGQSYMDCESITEVLETIEHLEKQFTQEYTTVEYTIIRLVERNAD